MPYKDKEPVKVYWTIGEVADAINFSPSGVRFWLEQFSEDTSKRTKNGARLFNKYEFINILAMNYLIKIEEYTMSGAKKKFDLWLKGSYEIPESYLVIPINLPDHKSQEPPQLP
jgi:DNA-binding transcriptional MerR regulator